MTPAAGLSASSTWRLGVGMPREGCIPGDILLVRDYSGDSDLLGNLIMAGERARYGDSDYARWTHSALIVAEDGHVAEALSEGVRLTDGAKKYVKTETLIVSPAVPPGDPRRAYAVRFALAQVGTKYDKLDFAALAGSLLFGVDLSLHSDSRFICSGLCARATESYTESGYQYPSEAMMPADLGDYWHALSGQPLPPLSFVGRLLDKLRAFTRSI